MLVSNKYVGFSKHRHFYLDIAAACDFYLNGLEVLDLIPCF